MWAWLQEVIIFWQGLAMSNTELAQMHCQLGAFGHAGDQSLGSISRSFTMWLDQILLSRLDYHTYPILLDEYSAKARTPMAMSLISAHFLRYNYALKLLRTLWLSHRLELYLEERWRRAESGNADISILCPINKCLRGRSPASADPDVKVYGLLFCCPQTLLWQHAWRTWFGPKRELQALF